MSKSMYATNKGVMMANNYDEVAKRLAGGSDYVISRSVGYVTVFFDNKRLEIIRSNKSTRGMKEYFVQGYMLGVGFTEGEYVCARTYAEAAREVCERYDGIFAFRVKLEDKGELYIIDRESVIDCNEYSAVIINEDGDAVWRMDELFAVDEFDAAMIVKGRMKEGWVLKLSSGSVEYAFEMESGEMVRTEKKKAYKVRYSVWENGKLIKRVETVMAASKKSAAEKVFSCNMCKSVVVIFEYGYETEYIRSDVLQNCDGYYLEIKYGNGRSMSRGVYAESEEVAASIYAGIGNVCMIKVSKGLDGGWGIKSTKTFRVIDGKIVR